MQATGTEFSKSDLISQLEKLANEMKGLKNQEIGSDHANALKILTKELLTTTTKEESQKWRDEQYQKIADFGNSILTGLKDAKDWTAEQWKSASTAVSNWCGARKEDIKQGWDSFTKKMGEGWDKCVDGMKAFGSWIAEKWNNAMDCLGKLWDEIKIGAHNIGVDIKTAALNFCTEMKYDALQIPELAQKAYLSVSDTYQGLKGAASGKIAEAFDNSLTGVRADLVQVVTNGEKQLEEAKKGLEPEAFAKSLKDAGLDGLKKDEQDKIHAKMEDNVKKMEEKLTESKAKLTGKAETREHWKDALEAIKTGTEKAILANDEKRTGVNEKMQTTTDTKVDIKTNRLSEAEASKQAYADKVHEARNPKPKDVDLEMTDMSKKGSHVDHLKEEKAKPKDQNMKL